MLAAKREEKREIGSEATSTSLPPSGAPDKAAEGQRMGWKHGLALRNGARMYAIYRQYASRSMKG